jgi:hypothetical protein
MKALKLLVLMVAVGALFTFSSCGGDGTTPEPPADQQLTKLSKTWKLTAVTLDGATMASFYKVTGTDQFKLTITGTKGASTFAYTTTGNPPSGSVWKGSSDWRFGTDPLTMIKRDLALTTPLDVTYTVTTTTLEIRFTFSGAGYTSQGRTEQTNGAWVFTFGL